MNEVTEQQMLERYEILKQRAKVGALSQENFLAYYAMSELNALRTRIADDKGLEDAIADGLENGEFIGAIEQNVRKAVQRFLRGEK